MKFIAHWYNQTEVIHTDTTPIEANSQEEATKMAYSRYDGRPPAPVLFLEEVRA